MRKQKKTDGLDPEAAKDLLEPFRKKSAYPGVEGEWTTAFAEQQCEHCKGLHTTKCPAIRRIAYHENGRVAEVEYFASGMWPAGDVLWWDDICEAAAQWKPDEAE